MKNNNWKKFMKRKKKKIKFEEMLCKILISFIIINCNNIKK